MSGTRPPQVNFIFADQPKNTLWGCPGNWPRSLTDKIPAMFRDRNLVIATKHQKESVIAPILEKELEVRCIVSEILDTDVLGTFSGEVERELDPIATARQKCLMGMELAKCDLGVASEGSFGPHPALFFVSADDEFLVFIDKANSIEIIVRELSTETNFNAATVGTERELMEFASNAGFPSHGLILRRSKNEYEGMIKGITDTEELLRTFAHFREQQGSAYVETDMRALYNPTRMRVIEAATQKLITKINSRCPQCATPGFDVTEARRGLPCSLCGQPTNSVLSYLFNCRHCQFSKEEMYPHQKTTEDPMYCDRCNP